MKPCKAREPTHKLKAKDKCLQQTWNAAKHSRYSQTRDTRTGIVNKLKTQRHRSHSPTEDSSIHAVNRFETQQETAYQLERSEKKLSADKKFSMIRQAVTDRLEAQDRYHQKTWNATGHSSHSPPEEPRSGIVNKTKAQRGSEATHQLESQGYTLLATWDSAGNYSPTEKKRQRVVSKHEISKARGLLIN